MATSIISGNVTKLGQPYKARVVAVSNTAIPEVVGYTMSDELTGDYSMDVAPYTGECNVAVIQNNGVTFEPSTTLLVGMVISPTEYNGYAYEVTQAGDTGVTEPTWVTTDGETVTSGTVTFIAQLLMRPLMNGYIKPVVTGDVDYKNVYFTNLSPVLFFPIESLSDQELYNTNVSISIPGTVKTLDAPYDLVFDSLTSVDITASTDLSSAFGGVTPLVEDLTINVWYKLTATGSGYRSLIRMNEGSNHSFTIGLAGGGGSDGTLTTDCWYVGVRNGVGSNGWKDYVGTTTSPQLNVWEMLTVTVNRTTGLAKLFINGVKLGEQVLLLDGDFKVTDMAIMSASASYSGEMKDVMYKNAEMSEADVLTLYNKYNTQWVD